MNSLINIEVANMLLKYAIWQPILIYIVVMQNLHLISYCNKNNDIM